MKYATVEDVITSFPHPVLPSVPGEPDFNCIHAIRKICEKMHVKLLPLPHPPVRARTDARTNPSAQRATQLGSVLARVYAVSRQNQITNTVP
jgi:hypothetical protein